MTELLTALSVAGRCGLGVMGVSLTLMAAVWLLNRLPGEK